MGVLEDWDNRCGEVLGELEERVGEVRRRAVGERRREEARRGGVQRAMDKGEKREGEGEGGEGERKSLRSAVWIGGRGRGRKGGGSQ